MANQDDQATHLSYAQALLELADSRGVTDQVAGDLKAIAEAVAGDASLKKYFADPSVSHTERADKIGRVFGGQTAEVLVGFLKLLNAKGRLGELSGIAKAFADLLSERAGEQAVEVIVPQALSDSELEDVRVQISTKIGKHARITQKVDESIIGGLVLKIGDKLIDGSVKSQLESMKRRLVAAV
ncbi:MAG: ATP synthase F1 subunit delta [Tepidisphaeraceae bacterium]